MPYGMYITMIKILLILGIYYKMLSNVNDPGGTYIGPIAVLNKGRIESNGVRRA